ncbi:MAG: sodium:proton antiporter [candidate division Zixibacteria bacterium]|nr:sodium:proton antiporter [candidate division Zixibacteria bacterium]
MFGIIAILISAAAVSSYINHRFIKLPTTIGLMVIGLSMSLAVVLLSVLGVDFRSSIGGFLEQIDFSEALMKGMLSFLLFAGALKINLNDLASQKFIIGALATFGVVAATFIIGTALFFILKLINLAIPYSYCLVFGALISPTDPVAVLAILKTVKVPKSLATKIAGESLFNDGIGVVVFIVMAGIAASGGSVSAGHVALLLVQEALGGVVFGLLLGWIVYRLLKSVDDHSVEVLLTLALVCGGYALAMSLHISGPIAIVVAGLLIGNYGRQFAMSDSTRDHLDKFWELIDEILNAVLFILIGFEVLVLSFTMDYFIVGLIAIPVTLAARFISVWLAITVLKFKREFTRNVVLILTWGGLRGGISIALALSLSAGQARDLIVSITYIIVVFSILVQGLTIKSVLRRLLPSQ